MKKISTLIFAKDTVANVTGLVRDVYQFSDEIIIVDSNTPTNKLQLTEELEAQHLNKARVFPAVAMGHPEPYQMYGLDKCSNEWVFYIDTDERIGRDFKRDLRGIVENADVDAFLVRKRELSSTGHKYFDSYQRRLFRKDAATYTGNVFFDPHIDGRERKLNPSYYLNHHFEYYENMAKGTERYFVLCAYEARQTYSDVFEALRRRPRTARLAELYARYAKRDPDGELTKRDYKLLNATVRYLAGETASLFKGRAQNMNFVLHNYLYILLEYDSFFKFDKSEREQQLQIAHEIRNEGGVIPYLRVDDRKVGEWIRRYDSDAIGGVQLFTKLLRDEHSTRALAKSRG